MYLLLLCSLIFSINSASAALGYGRVADLNTKAIKIDLAKKKKAKLSGQAIEFFVDYPEHKSEKISVFVDDEARFYKLDAAEKKKVKFKLQNANANQARGVQNTLVFLVADHLVSSESFIYLPDYLRRLYFSSANVSVNQYYKEVSDNAVSFNGRVVATPIIAEGLCSGGPLTQSGGLESLVDFIDDNFDLTQYQRLSLVFPLDNFCLGGAIGLGSVGNIRYTSSSGKEARISISMNLSVGVTDENDNFFINVASHEFGHNFGLRHDNGNACGEGIFNGVCTHIEYFGVHSLMGFAPNLAHLNAIHQEDLKWLKQNQISTINNDSFSAEFNLVALSEPDKESLKAIKIRRNDGRYYVVEYRNPSRLELEQFSSERLSYDGIQIYLDDTEENNSILIRKDFQDDLDDDLETLLDFLALSSFEVGDEFYDPVSDIRIIPSFVSGREASIVVQKGIEGGTVAVEPEIIELISDTIAIDFQKKTLSSLSFKINAGISNTTKIRVIIPDEYKKLFRIKKKSKKIKNFFARFPLRIASALRLSDVASISETGAYQVPITVQVFDKRTKTTIEQKEFIIDLEV